MRRQPQRKSSPVAMASTPARRRRGELARRTIAGWLNKHFYLRLHMTLIIALTFLAGMAATNVLMWLQANPLALRYGLTVTAAYLVFLALIRLWLWYIGIRAARSSDRSGLDLSSDGIDVTNINIGGFMSDPAPPGVEAGGGSFGGGGASGSWGEAATSTSSSSSSGGSDGASGLLDVGDDSGTIALVIAIVVAVIVAGVAALYLIYAAPAILSEVAFQGVLAAAMARRTRHLSNIGWVGAVWRQTFWAFAAVMAVAIAVGVIANHICPQAITLQQALHCRPL